MDALVLFALFTSPAWSVMLLALVTSHRRSPRTRLRVAARPAAAVG
jgi:hypothetical protein